MSPEERFSSRKWGDHLTDLQNLGGGGGGDLAFEMKWKMMQMRSTTSILLMYVEHSGVLLLNEKFGNRLLLMFWEKIAIFLGHLKNL